MEMTYRSVTGAPPPHLTAWVDEILGEHPGQVGALVSRSLGMVPGGLSGSLLTFWEGDQGRADAPGGSGEPAGDLPVTLGAPKRYRVVKQHLTSSTVRPTFLQTTVFDAPRDAAWTAAFQRASEERVWPAGRTVDGITGAFLCIADDGGTLALTLAVSVEALENALTAIMATQLLPWEDPAMLTGPDRVDIHRLLHADLPQPSLAS